MRIVRTIAATAALVLAASCATLPEQSVGETSLVDRGSLPLSGDITPAHDPVLIREGDTYYIYGTGQRGRQLLTARNSTDLRHWEELPAPFTAFPDWARSHVPGARNAWAPDIARAGDRYRLYYSISTFGSRQSAIGLMTSPTLDPAAPGHGWRDEGLVVSTTEGADHNAIDPNFIIDREGRHWLSYGSFWGGLKLIELDPATGLPKPGAQLIPISRRGQDVDGAVEAPFIIEHGGFYYQIASFGACCRGAESTYHLVVGRARDITGPYVDRDGTPMLEGGGTVLIQAGPQDRFAGPGHAGHLRDSDGQDYLVFHAYDRNEDGRPTLRMAKIRWNAEGWPELAFTSSPQEPS